MIPGFGGHLVSESLLERQIDPLAGARRHAERALLADCRRQAASLGPAASLRALLDGAAIPLLGVLGFDVVADVEMTSRALHATVGHEQAIAGLTVVSWNEPLDAFWRAAVVSARSRGAEWSFLFNGSHVRLFSTNRLHTRRFLEFALDVALDDPSAAVALLTTLHVEALTAADRADPAPLERMIALAAASGKRRPFADRRSPDGVCGPAQRTRAPTASSRRESRIRANAHDGLPRAVSALCGGTGAGPGVASGVPREL